MVDKDQEADQVMRVNDEHGHSEEDEEDLRIDETMYSNRHQACDDSESDPQSSDADFELSVSH